MNATQKKVAELNSIYAAVREWQRGAINQRELEFRLGESLTQEQTEAMVRPLYRTIGRESLAKLIAAVIGL